jgi:hypothetical protein
MRNRAPLSKLEWKDRRLTSEKLGPRDSVHHESRGGAIGSHVSVSGADRLKGAAEIRDLSSEPGPFGIERALYRGASEAASCRDETGRR